MQRQVEPIPIPAPALTPEEAVLPYTPHVYQGNPPAALPPSAEPLPWQKRQLEDQRRQKEYEEKQKVLEQKKKEQSEGGFFRSLSIGFESALNEASKGVNTLAATVSGDARNVVTTRLEGDFRSSFGLPGTERLMEAYKCTCINGAGVVDGWLYISQNYASFFGRLNGRQVVAFIIPLRNIASIQKGTTTPVTTAGTPPQVQPASSEPANAFQLFTLDRTVHTFYGFWSYDDAYNVLDHAWRASFQLPPPSLNPQYQQAANSAARPATDL